MIPANASAALNAGAYVLPLLLCGAAGYLLGSLNWSILLTKTFFHKEDIRKQGSGNAGMTNMLRSVGKLPALFTFIGDFLKCVAAVLLAWWVMSLFGLGSGEGLKVGQYVAGVCCVMGHIFPVYFGFRGGKGIVTSAAMMAMLDWRVFLLILATFLAIFLWKRIVSLASIVCACVYPVYAFLVGFFFDYAGSPLEGNAGYSLMSILFSTACALGIAAVVLVRHRSNMGRLRRGEEKPVSFGKKKTRS